MNCRGILTAIAGFALTAAAAHGQITKSDWGKTADGTSVALYTIHGPITVSLTNYGARLVSIEAPDKNGVMADVILGFHDLSTYENPKNTTYIGAIVGRYGNRIASGTFSIDGQSFHIPMNEKQTALHGGTQGFDRKVWIGSEIPHGVEFTLISPDGDMGFPGALTTHVRYTVLGHSLHIDYTATTDKSTVINITNHADFNLAGESSGTILHQRLTLNADNFTPIDAALIPTGKLNPVAGTPFDFKTPHEIGERIGVTNDQLKLAGGYDHNFVLNRDKGKMHLAAMALDPVSGRTLTVQTTEPGIQFYSGNFLDGTLVGKGGKPYIKYAGFCLETQHFPDSPNEPTFPSTLLKPGETFHSSSIFTFGVNN